MTHPPLCTVTWTVWTPIVECGEAAVVLLPLVPCVEMTWNKCPTILSRRVWMALRDSLSQEALWGVELETERAPRWRDVGGRAGSILHFG